MRFDAPKLSFARRPRGDDGVPAPHVDRAAARRAAQLARADDALAVLPGPNEAVHCLMTGRFDLMYVLARLADRLGPVDDLKIATLCYNARNLAELVTLLDSGKVKRLTLLCSAFFRDHNKQLWAETLEQLRPRGQRAAAARSHAKVVTFAFADGRRLTLEGSANLRSNQNREQLTMIDGAPVYDFHSAWITAAGAAHAGEEEREG
jgi:hypothetical protein